MYKTEIVDELKSGSPILMSEFKDENDHYDETVDDYDEIVEDSYDDGIAISHTDDALDEAFDEDTEEIDTETAHPKDDGSILKEEWEDSLQESEDYDELED